MKKSKLIMIGVALGVAIVLGRHRMGQSSDGAENQSSNVVDDQSSSVVDKGDATV